MHANPTLLQVPLASPGKKSSFHADFGFADRQLVDMRSMVRSRACSAEQGASRALSSEYPLHPDGPINQVLVTQLLTSHFVPVSCPVIFSGVDY
jgi:hypothetical protein